MMLSCLRFVMMHERSIDGHGASCGCVDWLSVPARFKLLLVNTQAGIAFLDALLRY